MNKKTNGGKQSGQRENAMEQQPKSEGKTTTGPVIATAVVEAHENVNTDSNTNSRDKTKNQQKQQNVSKLFIYLFILNQNNG